MIWTRTSWLCRPYTIPDAPHLGNICKLEARCPQPLPIHLYRCQSRLPLILPDQFRMQSIGATRAAQIPFKLQQMSGLLRLAVVISIAALSFEHRVSSWLQGRRCWAAQGCQWGPRPLTPRPGMPVGDSSPVASQNSALA